MALLTWSFSRDSILHSCERRYYFQYAVGARSNSKDPVLKEIALLKQLQTIPMWQGDCFHVAVKSWAEGIRAGNSPNDTHMLEELPPQMTQQWNESKAAVAVQMPRSKISCRLFEHEYGIDLAADALESAIRVTQRWLSSFLLWASRVNLPAAIRRAKKCWVDPDVFGPNAPSFKVHGTGVVVKVDLGFLTQEGNFEIWDWKTGKAADPNPRRIDPDALQVNVYQLWPHIAMDIPLDRIRAHLMYVATDPPEHKIHEIDSDAREYALLIIRRSLDRMAHFSTRGGAHPLSIEDFDYAMHPGLCRYCPFKRICLRSVGGEVK